ncbi:hypothetical protein [Methanosphaera sp.]|uniref:hypothetical protein n=1 Tax=Methanosphaera sp. TaxID=2666342 RepID=UPI0025D7F626|nr:hypothetical protein [Methanosphaera sp.]
MTEFNKCTCVKVNKDKMDLIKAKGLNLQDLLDKAMDAELNLSNVSDVQQKMDDLSLKIEKLKKERDASIKDCEKKIDILMKNLLESKEKEELYYNKQIHFLELELEYLQKHYDE